MKKFMLILIALCGLAISSFTALAQTVVFEGGGQIVEAPDDTKRPDWLVVSFGTEIYDNQTGNLQINFHNVGDDNLDGARFHGSDITVINYFQPDSNTCDAAIRFTVNGTLNGEEGYSVIFRAGDDDVSPDTIRIQLFQDGVEIYDTDKGEFTAQSSCVGRSRTNLDAGDVSIYLP